MAAHRGLHHPYADLGSQRHSWAPAAYNQWNDPKMGLNYQIAATFNLVFAFRATVGLSNTQIAQEVLTIEYGTYAPGATFKITIAGQVRKPVGPPEPYNAEFLIDPADPSAASGTGALATGAVQVTPGNRTISMSAVPTGLNVFAEVLERITWTIRMNTGLNSVQGVGVNPDQGFLAAVPATVPASGSPVVVKGLGVAMSTEFA